MNFKRGLKLIGFLLIAIGIFIIIIQPFSTTGAVIELSSSLSRIWFFVGLGLILAGSFFMGTDFNLEEKLVVSDINQISSRIKEIQPDIHKVALVVDASAAIKYGQENLDRFTNFLYDFKKAGGKIIMPDKNFFEVNREKIRDVLEKYTNPPEKGYKNW